ncbi:DnaD domain protein [Ruminococcaceae bacterium OttesenSCG-928-A16]|nr:DnaD domain protein [Ruminococcaceae bacterium OttesenSCG-928-A16]
MYHVVNNNGDTIAVPQIVFARLTASSAGETRFRVALYMLATGQADAAAVADALHIKTEKAERALEYWEGAGLLENRGGPAVKAPPVEAAKRQRLNTQEVAEASENDAMLGKLVDELQHIFGGVVSQADINVFVTLYIADAFPADLILIAASHCAAQKKTSARYIEKVLFGWRRDGITTCEEADAYLRLLAQREKREKQIATLLQIDAAGLTLAERKRIAEWFEEYHYGKEMVQAARLVAGDKGGNVRYLAGILKNWHGKGYRNPRDVQQAQENMNVRVQGPEASIAPDENILASMGRGKRRKEK